jgi:hypothetical protein
MLRILLAAGAALSLAGTAVAQTPADYPPCKTKADDHCKVMTSGHMKMKAHHHHAMAKAKPKAAAAAPKS